MAKELYSVVFRNGKRQLTLTRLGDVTDHTTDFVVVHGIDELYRHLADMSVAWERAPGFRDPEQIRVVSDGNLQVSRLEDERCFPLNEEAALSRGSCYYSVYNFSVRDESGQLVPLKLLNSTLSSDRWP